MPQIELRPGPGIRAIKDTGRALRALYLVTIREGVKKYMTARGAMSPLGRDTLQAALSGAYAAMGILLTRFLNSIPERMAMQIQSAAQRAPIPREIEMADFNLARSQVVRNTFRALGTTAEAEGFDLGGPLGAGLSMWSQAKEIGEKLGDDTRHKHPLADAIHDIEKFLWEGTFGKHNPLVKDPFSSDDEPDPKKPKPNPIVGRRGDFSGVVRTFYDPVTSHIINYKGIARKRKFNTLERYSPFWKHHNRFVRPSGIFDSAMRA